MHNAQSPASRYVIDVETGAETARLLDLDQLMNAYTGLFPMPMQDAFPGGANAPRRVLDLACGPGGWVLEVGYNLPEVEVVGVDLSASMVQYAAARALTQQRRTVSFEVMDVTEPLSFPDASFVYVNARFLAGFMRPTDWLPLLRECRRVLVPEGTLCLTESEWPITTSKAFETLKRKVSMALWLAKQSVSADGQELGITAMQACWLREAGYLEIAHQAHAVEWSAGTTMGAASYHQWEATFALLRPFVLTMGLATAETYDGLSAQMLADLRSPAFCAVSYPLSVWGKTPEAAEMLLLAPKSTVP